MKGKRPSRLLLKEWAVPYQTVHRGLVVIPAETAEQAEALVDAGSFDNDPGEERADWERTGKAREWPPRARRME